MYNNNFVRHPLKFKDLGDKLKHTSIKNGFNFYTLNNYNCQGGIVLIKMIKYN
jgi:hypothetical protein